MQEAVAGVLKSKLDADSFAKLDALDNEKLHAFVADAVELCGPESVKVCSDDPADIAYIRDRAKEIGEEGPLATEGHTVHFDGYVHEARHDQARDKGNTRYLVPAGMALDRTLNQVARQDGLGEVREFLRGAMAGKQMYVRFFCLGPTDSVFSIPCVQITDSAYVAHSEDLLYRRGYEEFRRLGDRPEFFRFLHSAGRLENNTSADIDRRRVYIDIAEEMVYSVNTQYAGNTVGLKKLALRLAIRKADREGWLAEHMFVMGVHGPGGRVTYFTGAFPSACGKTSTAMVPGETIVGDDLAYFRAIDGEARAVNVESGIFGIIRDVNERDDRVIWDVLNGPGEVIFSNVLITDGKPYWLGMYPQDESGRPARELPEEGVNYAGRWHKGKTDANGREVHPSHKNARYTVRLTDLNNLDDKWDLAQGVPVGGIIYGGRDGDTWVPVKQSFDWAHGIVTMGASLESETTAATLGQEGVRAFNLMSNLDFLAIPLGKYIANNLGFADALATPPLIFATNYFLRSREGEYLNDKTDKTVWLRWMELRVHGDVEAIEAPTGLLPKYEDLVPLFRERLGKAYSRDDYVEQFTIRVPESLAKVDRIEAVYRKIQDTPEVVFTALAAQRKRLEALRAAKGDYVSPLDL
jgi:phosphoenolpyruvate carboxykinase (GTP)